MQKSYKRGLKSTTQQRVYDTLLALALTAGAISLWYFVLKIYEPNIIIKVIEITFATVSSFVLFREVIIVSVRTPLSTHVKETIVASSAFCIFILWLAWYT